MNEIRNNLATSLTDENIRKKYLHPKKRSAIELLKYAYEPFKNDTKIKLSLIIFAILNGLLPILQAFIMYYLIELVSLKDIEFIISVVAIYSLINIVLSIISSQILKRTYSKYNRVRTDFIHKYSDKLMAMDYGLYENSEFMSTMQRGYEAFSRNDTGLEGIYHNMYPLISNLFSFVILSIILTYISPLVVLFAILSIILQITIKQYIDKYRHKNLEELNKNTRKINTYTNEASDFKYGKDIRLYGFKENFIKGFTPVSNNIYNFFRKYSKLDALFSPITSLLTIGIEVIAYYFITGDILNNDISLKMLTLIITSLILYLIIIDNVIKYLSEIREYLLYFEDSVDILKADLKSLNGHLDIEGKIDIEFKNVSFSYPNTEKVILDNLSFKIKSDEKIALVGINGAGKSTIVKLILGLYKVTKGAILINGINANDIDREKIFKAFSVLLQEVEPFAMTIAENVSGSFDNIDRERVKKSLEISGLSYKIDDLPLGIDTPLTRNIDENGTLFSGGENQKLALARALYKKDSRAMILDEPTASLDAIAEERFYKSIEKIAKDKTLIFISHRLLSTRFCDKIMLLDDGVIKEYGTHDELMKKDGLYKNMYDTQKKYYEENKDERKL